MHYYSTLVKLCALFVWLSSQSRSEPNEVSERTVEIDKYNLVLLANTIGLSYILSPKQIREYSCHKFLYDTFSNVGAKKYQIGNKSPISTKSLKLTLPTTSTVEQYAKYMLKDKILRLIDHRDPNSMIDDNLANTAIFCDYTLCPENKLQSITVNPFELFSYSMRHFHYNNATKKMDFSKHEINIPVDATKKMIEYTAKYDGHYKKISLNCLILIPKQYTISEFVGNCARKIHSYGNEDQFMTEIMNECRGLSIANGQRVEWYKVIGEMERYYFLRNNSNPSFQLGTGIGKDKVDLKYLTEHVCVRVVETVFIEFNNIPSKIKFTDPIDIGLELMKQVVQISQKNFKVEITTDLNFAFTEIVNLCHYEEYTSCYNLSKIPSDKFKEQVIGKNEFDEIVRKELVNTKFPLPIDNFDKTSFNSEQSEISIKNNRIMFSKFPFIKGKFSNSDKMIREYLYFIKNLLNQTEPPKTIVEVFWSKFLAEKTLDEFKFSHFKLPRSGKEPKVRGVPSVEKLDTKKTMDFKKESIIKETSSILTSNSNPDTVDSNYENLAYENSKYNESEIGHSDIDKFPIANESIDNELIANKSIDENTQHFQLSSTGNNYGRENTTQNNTKSLAKKEDQNNKETKAERKQRLNSEEEAFKKKLKIFLICFIIGFPIFLILGGWFVSRLLRKKIIKSGILNGIIQKQINQ